MHSNICKSHVADQILASYLFKIGNDIKKSSCTWHCLCFHIRVFTVEFVFHVLNFVSTTFFPQKYSCCIWKCTCCNFKPFPQQIQIDFWVCKWTPPHQAAVVQPQLCSLFTPCLHFVSISQNPPQKKMFKLYQDKSSQTF